jgi:hypothetical protein
MVIEDSCLDTASSSPSRVLCSVRYLGLDRAVTADS